MKHLGLIGLLSSPILLNAGIRNYVETDGMVAVEAEYFVSQSNDSIRRWYVTDAHTVAPDFPDPDGNHADSASGGAYVEILPDTRTNHDEKAYSRGRWRGLILTEVD